MADIPDFSNPASILEAQESDQIDPTIDGMGMVLRRVLAWVVEGKSVAAVGMRALTLARKVSPDLVEGATLATIAKQMGHGRSSTHRLDKELTRLFDLRSPLEKSADVKRTLSDRWHARNRATRDPSPN